MLRNICLPGLNRRGINTHEWFQQDRETVHGDVVRRAIHNFQQRLRECVNKMRSIWMTLFSRIDGTRYSVLTLKFFFCKIHFHSIDFPAGIDRSAKEHEYWF